MGDPGAGGCRGLGDVLHGTRGKGQGTHFSCSSAGLAPSSLGYLESPQALRGAEGLPPCSPACPKWKSDLELSPGAPRFWGRHHRELRDRTPSPGHGLGATFPSLWVFSLCIPLGEDTPGAVPTTSTPMASPGALAARDPEPTVTKGVTVLGWGGLLLAGAPREHPAQPNPSTLSFLLSSGWKSTRGRGTSLGARDSGAAHA